MSLIGLLAGAVVAAVAVWIVLRFVVVPVRLARYHADIAALRWVPSRADADHAAHLPLVHEYETWGYRVDSRGRLALGRSRPAVTLMAHDDLSVVEIASRSDGCASSITSLLAGGTCVLETMAAQTAPSVPGRLVQVFPGATVHALVTRHREALTGLAERGIVAVAHPRGPAGVFETGAHILGRAPAPTPREAAALGRGEVTVHLGPLARQPGIEEQLRAAGLAAVGWSAP